MQQERPWQAMAAPGFPLRSAARPPLTLEHRRAAGQLVQRLAQGRQLGAPQRVQQHRQPLVQRRLVLQQPGAQALDVDALRALCAGGGGGGEAGRPRWAGGPGPTATSSAARLAHARRRPAWLRLAHRTPATAATAAAAAWRRGSRAPRPAPAQGHEGGIEQAPAWLARHPRRACEAPGHERRPAAPAVAGPTQPPPCPAASPRPSAGRTRSSSCSADGEAGWGRVGAAPLLPVRRARQAAAPGAAPRRHRLAAGGGSQPPTAHEPLGVGGRAGRPLLHRLERAVGRVDQAHAGAGAAGAEGGRVGQGEGRRLAGRRTQPGPGKQ